MLRGAMSSRGESDETPLLGVRRREAPAPAPRRVENPRQLVQLIICLAALSTMAKGHLSRPRRGSS